MKLFIPFLFLIVSSCFGQAKRTASVSIDTVKLFNPYPESDEIGANEMHIFERNIALVGSNYTLTYDSLKRTFYTLKDAGSFILTNSKMIASSKFYIITENSTSFDTIQGIIKILADNQIKNYKVINYQLYITQPQPLALSPINKIPKEFNERDSAFIIKIEKNHFKVSHFGKDTTLMNVKNIDNLIKSIRPKSDYFHKIIISGTRQLLKQKQTEIMKMLERNGYEKVSITNEYY